MTDFHDDGDGFNEDGYETTPEQDRFSARMSEIREAYQNFCERHSDFHPVGQEAALFRNIFGAYPCYRENVGQFSSPRRLAGSASIEPVLAQIKKLHDEQDPRLRIVRVEDLDFGQIMPGYKPLTRVYLVSVDCENPSIQPNQTDDGPFFLFPEQAVNIAGMTIMHVVESNERGAPSDQAYLYMWPGGLEYYNDPSKEEELQSVVTKNRVITFANPYVWPDRAEADDDDGDDADHVDPMDMIG